MALISWKFCNSKIEKGKNVEWKTLLKTFPKNEIPTVEASSVVGCGLNSNSFLVPSFYHVKIAFQLLNGDIDKQFFHFVFGHLQ